MSAQGQPWEESEDWSEVCESPSGEKQKPDLGFYVGTLGTPRRYPLGAQTRNFSNSMWGSPEPGKHIM